MSGAKGGGDKVLRDGYSLGYKPYLDGIRGIAVTAVIFRHGDTGLMAGGFLGVDMFFALSGYLITSLLLREASTTGRIDLPRFWMRRALRILPALFLLMLAFAIYALTQGLLQSSVMRELWPTLLYVANWTHALGFGFPYYLGHTWSLAIEEQFYVIWPLAVALIFLPLGSRRSITVLLALIVSIAIWRYGLYLVGTPFARIYAGTDTHSDGLLIGATVAYLECTPMNWRARLACESAKILPGAVAILVIMLLFGQRDHPTMYLTGYGFAAGVAALAVFVLGQGHGSWLRGLLEWRPLVAVGRISYGLYLWHGVIFMILRHDHGASVAMINTIGIGLSIACALVSFLLIERPALRLKARFAVA